MATANTRVVNGINTRMLHNKDYVEVNERVRILHALRKSGEIKEFEMLESEPYEVAGRLLWRVRATIDGKLYIGNAEVKLDAPKNSPDGTNPFECAETSAFGRMLAFAGLGTVESLASYDKIIRSQPFTKVIEQSDNGVIEAASGTRQIEAPKVDEQAARRFINPLKMKALKAGFIAGSHDAELIKAWHEAKRATFLREVSDAEMIGSEELRVQMRDAIDRHVQLNQSEQKAS